MSRNPLLYLRDILDSITKIQNYTDTLTSDVFNNDSKTIDAVIRNLEIIGEAANRIPAEVSTKNPQIPWEKMVSMRNKVMHEYFGVDTGILWQTIKEDLPPLKDQVEDLIKSMG